MWYKLDGDDIIAAMSMDDKQITESRKRQNLTRVKIGDAVDVRISTVFLSLDHGWRFDGKVHDPVLFESMVFLDRFDYTLDPSEFLNRGEIQVRYETIKGARKGHKRLVEHVVNELTKKSLGEVKVENIHLSL